MKYFKYYSCSFLLALFFLLGAPLLAQEDLLNELNSAVGEQTDYTFATFKSTRIINGNSIEQMKTRQLDFRVNHRFGTVDGGAYTLFGLDQAFVNLSLEYGITDWLQVGIRRGTYKKTYDGSVKLRILRQSSGKKVMPVSITYFADAAVNTLKFTNPNIENVLINRLSFTHQLLIARKFNERLSLQLSPSFVHRNLVNPTEENNTYAVGFGGRYKITRRVGISFEYFWVGNTTANTDFHNSASIGVDIETGGHVFQLFLTNSTAMVESAFIPETRGNWLDGGIRFGFNISRVFAF